MDSQVNERPGQPGHTHEHHVVIIINDVSYESPERVMTGEQLRSLVAPPIGPDNDLWLEEAHGDDKLIRDEERVELHTGMRFFSTPRHINPGSRGIQV